MTVTGSRGRRSRRVSTHQPRCICVPDFDRARAAARGADQARARGEDRPLLGISGDGQGVLRHRRAAHHLGLAAMRGMVPPPGPALPVEHDLAVVGPMARTARDLTLLLDVMAGSDPLTLGAAYDLTLPPARHERLRDFRVLVVDEHPLIPTGSAVRAGVNSRRELHRHGWRRFFAEFDAVVCPITPTPAFPHDHDHGLDPRERRIDVDGAEYPYFDQLVWAGLPTMPGLPATAAPAGRSPEGLPVGVQLIGPSAASRHRCRACWDVSGRSRPRQSEAAGRVNIIVK